MTIIDEYIGKANSALRSNDAAMIDKIAREIVSAFNTEIPNLSHYRGQRSIDAPREHSASDLKKLVGKLRVLQESKDAQRYGEFGLASITDSINQLQNAIAEGYSEEQFKLLFEKIDNIYANRYGHYVVGLCGYLYNDDSPDEAQAQLRIEKLRDFRDEEMRRFKLAQFQSALINVSQSQEAHATATSIAIANLIETSEKIDEISFDKLSEDDKEYLKGLLLSLEQSIAKEKGDSGGKLKKILEFLADKSADAFIAAAPFVWNLVQSM